jgi:hypothetical protein
MRVIVEHCIGILKNRFQTLKGLRQRIGGKRSVKRAVEWVKACAILHNMALECDEEWSGRDVGEVVAGEQLFAQGTIVEDAAAAARREVIKRQVLEFNS